MEIRFDNHLKQIINLQEFIDLQLRKCREKN